jgi:hypothetical protein
MARNASEEVVADARGRPLLVGDLVQSSRFFDQACFHLGTVTEVDPESQTITVRHKKSCCEPGRVSSNCNAWIWTKVDRLFKRQTAWEKILADDD